MEVRLQPRSDGEQRCLSFTLNVDARSQHHAIPRFHGKHRASLRYRGQPLASESHSAVDGRGSVRYAAAARRLRTTGPILTPWSRATTTGKCFCPATSHIPARASNALRAELNCERRGNPLDLLTEFNEAIYKCLPMCPTAPKLIRRSKKRCEPARASARTLRIS